MAFELEQRLASRNKGGDVRAAKRRQAVVEFERRRGFALGLQQLGEVAHDVEIVRREGQRPAQKRLRFVQFAAPGEQHGEVLQRLARFLFGRDGDGAPQMAFGLVEALQLAQGHGEVHEGVVGVRPLRHGNASRRQGVVEAALGDQRLGKVQMRADGARIGVDDVLEERRLVAVDAGLPPGQRSKQQHEGNAAGGCGSAPQAGQSPCGHRAGADGNRHRADASQVLVAIGHEGEQHVGVVNEAERRRQRDDEEQRPRKRASPDAVAQHPQRPSQGKPSDEGQPRKEVADLNVPARVDDGQVRRPCQLAEVEPHSAGSDQEPLDEGMIEGCRRLGGDQQQIERDQRQRHDEEGRQPRDIRQRNAPAAPPVQDQQRDRQRDDHVLRQHAGGQQPQRTAVAPAACSSGASPAHFPGGQEAQPHRHAAEVAQRGEHVLAFDGPGHGFHVQWMNGEHRGDEPRAGGRERRQDAPQQHGVGGMQQYVHGVVAVGRESPELVLQPERGVDQRPIEGFIHLHRREPDALQASQVVERGFADDELQVVPDEAAPQDRWQIARQRQRDQCQTGEHRLMRWPTLRLGRRRRLRHTGRQALTSVASTADHLGKHG